MFSVNFDLCWNLVKIWLKYATADRCDVLLLIDLHIDLTCASACGISEFYLGS